MYNIAWFPNALTVNPHPLVFTVRATTCVYSDSLDWVIDFTPYFTLRYNENHGRYQVVRDCVYLSYLRGCLIVMDCVYLLSKHTNLIFGQARRAATL